MKLLELLEAMSERHFGARMARKTAVFVMYGQGAAVDKQNERDSIRAFTDAIQSRFNMQFTIGSAGRFGMNKNTGAWEFDASMAGAGHPSHWRSDSRGYYCELKNSVFLFPKDDYGFQALLRDFSVNVLRGKPIKEI